MLKFIIAACAVASAAAAASAQTRIGEAPQPAQKPAWVSGCAPVETLNANRFLVPPPRSRALYRSVGAAVLHARNGVSVFFRLVPSTNLAAQAGSLDPTIPAMAFVSGDQFRGGPAPARAPTVHIATGTAPVRMDCLPR